MDRIPSPKDLRAASGAAQSLAYAVGLAGVVAGGVLWYREGDIAFAVIAWVVTFAVGAMLMIAALVTRAMASLLARLAAIESDLQVLLRDRARDIGPVPERDPWAGHHPH